MSDTLSFITSEANLEFTFTLIEIVASSEDDVKGVITYKHHNDLTFN